MPAIDGYILGYGGHGRIGSQGSYSTSNSCNGNFISILSGSVVRNLQIPSAGTFYLDNIVKSKMRMGFGTYSFNGNVTFEMTEECLGIFSQGFFGLESLFSLEMFDGEEGIIISNNVWNSVNFNYNSQQIPTCSIGFLSNNGGSEDFTASSRTTGGSATPVQYWNASAGGAEAESFNLTFSRSVTNVYLNNDLKVPSYMKAGVTEISLSITCFDIDVSGLSCKLGKNKTISISGGAVQNLMQGKGYNVSGINSAGMRTFTFTGIQDSGVTGDIFTVS